MRELSSPLVDQSARCPVRELEIRKLVNPRVVQLPIAGMAVNEPTCVCVCVAQAAAHQERVG